MSVTIREGSAIDVLRTLPSESVQCVITSPPYFGLRAYGTNPQVWGGDLGHEHEWGNSTHVRQELRRGVNLAQSAASTRGGAKKIAEVGYREFDHALCPCGAWRGELGSEPTPSLFIEHLLTIFDEVWRVLRNDGTLWCNLGDSYSGGGKGPTGHNGIGDQEQRQGFAQVKRGSPYGIPDKNLLLIPERFAIGMQERGWTVRSRIAWCKTSAMPESVRDRPTSAWEHIWLFSKSARYFYDAEAVRQKASVSSLSRYAYVGADGRVNKHGAYKEAAGGSSAAGFGDLGRTKNPKPPTDGNANLRNWWALGPEPSSLEHYAGFPTELPKRCILAGTSEKGACPACGAPWVRSASKESVTGRTARNGLGNGELAAGLRFGDVAWATRDWAPSCSCDAGPPIPQTVLDPFLGSGTTALVADRLGRDAIGIELNPTYARMARDRIANDAPMVSEPVEVVATAQLGLFGEVAG